MADLEIAWLRSFVEVVECRGFGRAARRLNRTQSTVSLHIRQLEQVTGSRLIERGPRRFQITDSGQALFADAGRLLALHDEALARLSQPRLTGAVTVAISEDFASRQMPRILREFSATHPAVRLEVRCGLAGDMRAAFRRGEADLLIARRLVDGSARVAGKPLWREALVWAGGADVTVLAPDAPVPLVLFGEGCVYRAAALAALKQAGRRWRIAYAGNALAGVQGAVLAGLGATVLGRDTLAPGLRALDRLPALPISEIALETRPRPSAAVAFLAQLIERRLAPAAAVGKAA